MKLSRYLIFSVFLLFLGGFTDIDLCEDISSAIRAGDARQLASHFANTVDLTILKTEDTYSKTQAEQIVRDFFLKNPPKTFSVLHKGSSKEGTLYSIGTLTTTKGVVFRTSFFVRQSGGKYLIQELRFETE